MAAKSPFFIEKKVKKSENILKKVLHIQKIVVSLYCNQATTITLMLDRITESDKKMKQSTLNIIERQFRNEYLTNGATNRRFFYTYGEITFEDAWQIKLSEVLKRDEREEKINAFEQFLKDNGAKVNYSNVSSSRYYNWGMKTYRFSTHIHPTGTMTTEDKIDFAANPELIDEINF